MSSPSVVFARCAGVALFAAAALPWPAARSTPSPELRWFKGNLHTHTINSDGDSAPDAVVRWYKERRYHFLALTDHNYFTDPQGLNDIFAADERFLLLTGEEVTSRHDDKPIHVNAWRLDKTIPPEFGSSILETLQQNVDAIRAAGALPSLNHPNFGWALTADQLAVIRNLPFFEVYNGHPATNDFGGGDHPSLDRLWDAALSAGNRLWGIAVDDAHVFKRMGPDLSNPGRGWVHVQAAELSAEALYEALLAGRFYASTGVELATLERLEDGLRVAVQERPFEAYRIDFIGKDGALLERSREPEAEYRLQPSDGYVRAKIYDSNGRFAWTQPVFLSEGFDTE